MFTKLRWTLFQPKASESNFERILFYVERFPERTFLVRCGQRIDWTNIDSADISVMSGKFYLCAMEELHRQGSDLIIGHYAFVSPQYAGKKKGYGARVIRAFASTLKRHGSGATELHFKERIFWKQPEAYSALYSQIGAVPCAKHSYCFVLQV